MWSVQVVVHLDRGGWEWGCGVYWGLLFKLYAECLYMYSTRGLLWNTLLSITRGLYQTIKTPACDAILTPKRQGGRRWTGHKLKTPGSLNKLPSSRKNVVFISPRLCRTHIIYKYSYIVHSLCQTMTGHKLGCANAGFPLFLLRSCASVITSAGYSRTFSCTLWAQHLFDVIVF